MADINVSVGIDPKPAESGARVIKRTLGDLSNDAKKTERSFFNIGNALKGAVAYLSVRQLVEYADTWKLVQGRLSLVTNSTAQLTRVTGDLFAIAQRTRNGFVAVADTYSGIARATRELGTSEQDLKRVTETISKAVTISGAPAASAEAALFQLRQGLAAGALRGQELNSVLEQTPRVAEAIANGLGLTIGQLRKFAEEGKLTASAVLDALKNQSGTIDAEFAKLPTTIGQSLTKISNSVLRLVGDFDKVTGITAAVSWAFSELADWMDKIQFSFAEVGDSSLTLGESVVSAFAVFGLTIKDTFVEIGKWLADWMQVQIDKFVLWGQDIGSYVVAALDPTRSAYQVQNQNRASSERQQRIDEFNNGPGLGGRMSDAYHESITATREYIEAQRELNSTLAGGGTAGGGITGGGGANSATEAAKKAADQFKKLRDEMTDQIADLRTLNSFYEQTPDLIQQIAADIEVMAQARKLDKNMTRAQKDELVGYMRELQRQKALLASNERIKNMQDELRIINAEIGLQNVSAQQRERIISLMKAEQEIRKESAGLTEEQIKKELDLNTAIIDGNQALERAKQEREAMIKPIETAIESIQGAFSDAFQNIFTRGVKSFSDLGSAIKGIFVNLAAQMATLWIFKSTGINYAIGNMFGGSGGSSAASAASGGGGIGNFVSLLSGAKNLLSGGISSTLVSGLDSVGSLFGIGNGSFIGPMQNGGLAGGLSQYSTLTNGAWGGTLGGTLGGIGGSLLAKGIFGSKGIGADIGGTIGGIAGSFIPVPVLGPLIGSFIGTAIGGLFGNKKPTNAWANADVNFDTGASRFWNSGKGNAAENQKIMETAYGQVLQFAQGFNQLGIGKITGRITAEQGVRDPGYAYVNGVKVSAGAGQFGQLAINALKEALKQTKITNSDVKTVVANGNFSDLGKLLSNVQFATNFRDNLAALRDGYNLENDIRKQAKASVEAVTAQLKEFVDTTKSLGLSTTDATAAVKKYIDNLVAGVDPTKDMTSGEQTVMALRATWDSMSQAMQLAGYSAQQAASLIETGFTNALAKTRSSFGQEIEDAILSITDPQQLAIKQLDREFDTIRRNAVAFGYDLNKVEELYGLKRVQIVEQVNQQMLTSYKGIKDYLDSMLLRSDSSLSDSGRIVEAQRQFDEVLGLARGGDSNALGSVTNKAETLRQLMRGYLGSGTEYASFETMLRSSLQALLPTGYATGTNFAPPGWAMVAERGAEMVRFRGGEQVVGSGTTGRIQSEIVTELQRGNSANSVQMAELLRIIAEQGRQLEALNSRLDRYMAAQPAAGGRR